MDKLKYYLNDYRTITLSLIDILESNSFDKLQIMLDKRQEIIALVEEIKYNKDDFSTIANELELRELQNRLDNLFTSKRTALLEEIKKISTSKNVQNSYNNAPNYDSFFFNKKF